MVLINFKENIQVLLKMKELLIPQIDGNFIKDWEIEAYKYQSTSEHIIMELKHIHFIEGLVTAISAQFTYLRENLENYHYMSEMERDKFKRLYVLAALGLIAKLKLILFFSTYISLRDNKKNTNGFRLSEINFISDLNRTRTGENAHIHKRGSDCLMEASKNGSDTYNSNNNNNNNNTNNNNNNNYNTTNTTTTTNNNNNYNNINNCRNNNKGSTNSSNSGNVLNGNNEIIESATNNNNRNSINNNNRNNIINNNNNNNNSSSNNGNTTFAGTSFNYTTNANVNTNTNFNTNSNTNANIGINHVHNTYSNNNNNKNIDTISNGTGTVNSNNNKNNNTFNNYNVQYVRDATGRESVCFFRNQDIQEYSHKDEKEKEQTKEIEKEIEKEKEKKKEEEKEEEEGGISKKGSEEEKLNLRNIQMLINKKETGNKGTDNLNDINKKFVQIQNPPLNTMNSYYMNQLVHNNYDELKYTHLYENKKKEHLQQQERQLDKKQIQIEQTQLQQKQLEQTQLQQKQLEQAHEYQIIENMSNGQSKFQTSSSSSASSETNSSYQMKKNYYVPNNFYYPPNSENIHFGNNVQNFTVPYFDKEVNMYGNDVYY